MSHYTDTSRALLETLVLLGRCPRMYGIPDLGGSGGSVDVVTGFGPYHNNLITNQFLCSKTIVNQIHNLPSGAQNQIYAMSQKYCIRDFVAHLASCQ